jgi:HAD superfamily hydrolase (TIGR01509 family)
MGSIIKGVIFDFNGTLFFDSDKHERAWKIFSEEARSYPFSDSEITTHVHGRTNKSILEYLFQKEISDEVLEAYIRKKENYYRKACLEDTANLKLVDGAAELFRFLIQEKIAMTIATAADMTNVLFFFKQFHLYQWFDIKKTVYDNGEIVGKPAPDMYLKAAEMINVKPSECLVFEDSESGILAAHNAGIGKIISVDPKFDNRSHKEIPLVDAVISDFKMFPKSILD